jgi:hypothetical protein
MLVALLACLLSASEDTPSIHFLFPEDLIQARGVTLEAQLPEPGLKLLEKDLQRPKLWYAPVAAERTSEGARIWYERVDSAEKESTDQRTLCVGDIRNGAWTSCVLNPVPPAWGGINNVCLRRSPHKPTWGGFNVFQILRDESGYHLLYWDQPSEKSPAGALLAHSNNGLKWIKASGGAVFTEYNDAFTLLSYGGDYVLYQTALAEWPDKPYPDNLDKKRRVISLRRSKDLRAWTQQQVLLSPDKRDKPETEFYLMKAFRYGHAFAGLLMKYYADPNLPGRHSAILKNELIVSADGVKWQRPFRGTDLGFWSYADPVLLQARLHFVVCKEGVMGTLSYPQGRLTAVCAGHETGEFVTRSFRCSMRSIMLDVDAEKGWIEAQLLDEAGCPVQGTSMQRLENVEGTHLKMKFGGNSSSAEDSSKNHLRVRLYNAKLFALTAMAGTPPAALLSQTTEEPLPCSIKTNLLERNGQVNRAVADRPKSL